MREPAAREAQSQDEGRTRAIDAIGDAARRLDRALTRLETQVGDREPGADLFDRDRANLAADLDAARARERDLEAAAAAASLALGRAAAEVRLALGEDAIEPADEGDLFAESGEDDGQDVAQAADGPPSSPSDKDPH